MLVLKMVNNHLAKLTRQYTATQKGHPRALAIAEELSQVGTVRDEIQRIHEKLEQSGQPPMETNRPGRSREIPPFFRTAAAIRP